MTMTELERPAARASAGRLLAAPAPDHVSHVATHGPLPLCDGPQLLEQVRISGLTGRGGAGFPTAVKLAALAGQSRPVVVANAAEGEPASHKDRQLLLSAPHLVLDGLQLAALITGASQAYLYVRPELAGRARQALGERPVTGPNRVPVRVVEAGSGFVAGQETAVVSALNGGPAVPQFARVRVSERGVGGRPTLVQNVETLAQLALIARHGGAWFAAAGTPGASGTFLATVHLDGEERVWEVPHGLPLRSLLQAARGDRDAPHDAPARAAGSGWDGELPQAVLIGGYHGTWLPLPAALDAPLSAAGLAPFGGGLGAGVIVPLAGQDCGLQATARIVRYLAAESAKQCGPCQFGLPHLARLVSDLAAGRAGQGGVAAIRQAVGLVTGRGACHHPDGTARLVRSALLTFEQDVVLHGHGRCLAAIAEPYGGTL